MMSNKPFVMFRYPYIPYILAGPPCIQVPVPTQYYLVDLSAQQVGLLAPRT